MEQARADGRRAVPREDGLPVAPAPERLPAVPDGVQLLQPRDRATRWSTRRAPRRSRTASVAASTGEKNEGAQAPRHSGHDGQPARRRGPRGKHPRHEIRHPGRAEGLREVSVDPGVLRGRGLPRHVRPRSGAGTRPARGHIREDTATRVGEAPVALGSRAHVRLDERRTTTLQGFRDHDPRRGSQGQRFLCGCTGSKIMKTASYFALLVGERLRLRCLR